MGEYMTTQEVAETLRTSAETVRYWRHRKKGPPSFKVGRRVLYAAEDVHAFIAEAREKTHQYMSTACQHSLHAKCRKVCKFCDASCQCTCHE